MADAEPPPKTSDGSLSQLILPVVVLTLLAAGSGGFFGWSLPAGGNGKDAETHAPQETAQPAHEGAAGSQEKKAPEEKIDPRAGLLLKELAPMVTNLAGPGKLMVRLQAAVLYDPKGLQHADALFAEIASDTVAYLRTVEVASLEGGLGLRFLEEELAERASARSEGRVRKFIVESLVVQ